MVFEPVPSPARRNDLSVLALTFPFWRAGRARVKSSLLVVPPPFGRRDDKNGIDSSFVATSSCTDDWTESGINIF
jgi:hypothetical protein